MAGQFDTYENNYDYNTLNPKNSLIIKIIDPGSNAGHYLVSGNHAIKPSLNLKSNVIITGGDGTLQNPFTLALQ